MINITAFAAGLTKKPNQSINPTGNVIGANCSVSGPAGYFRRWAL
jgi:hypothetical protein